MSSRQWTLFLALVGLLAELCSLTGAEPAMAHEPVEHLKAHLPKTSGEVGAKLEKFLKLPKQDMIRRTAQIEKKLKTLLKRESHVSASLLHETKVLAQRMPSEIRFNSTFLLPHGSLLSIMSTSLPILLENYKAEIIFKPIGEVLKGKHSSDPKVKKFLSESLFDLLTKLPQISSDSFLEDSDLLNNLNQRGRAAFYYINTVLDTVAEEAWKDALISVAMERSAFSEDGFMMTSLYDLTYYSNMLSVDLVNFYEAPKSARHPLDAGHYLFGWWINCARQSKAEPLNCLLPHMPDDTVVMLGRALRVYCMPSVNMHFIVGNIGDGSGSKSINEVIQQDELIWKQIYSVVSPSSSASSSQKTKKETSKEKPTPPQEKDEEMNTEDPPQEEESTPPSPQEEEVEEDSSQTPSQTIEDSSPAPLQEEENTQAPPQEEEEEESTQAPPQEEENTQAPPEEEENTQAPPEEENMQAPPTEDNTAVPEPVSAQEEEDEVIGESINEHEPIPPPTPQDTVKPTLVKDTDTSSEDHVVGEDEEKGQREKREENVEKSDEEEEDDVTPLARAVYVGWPIAVFLFYTIFSHVWVYWVMHLLWIVLSSIFRGMHNPRPKSSKQD